jgi:hypothetical protein
MECDVQRKGKKGPPIDSSLFFSQSEKEEEVETNEEIPNAQHEVIKKSIGDE